MVEYTQFKFCPRCASKNIGEKEGKALVCSDCGFMYYFNPASACGCIITTDFGVLMVVRAREPQSGTLDLPGGFCDFGESLEEAVKREIREELSISLKQLKFFASFPNIYRYKTVTYQTIDAFFTATIDNTEAIVLENEVSSYEFVNAQTFDESRVGFESVKRALKLYFKR